MVMNNSNEKFKEVVKDVISGMADIKYEDREKNIMLISLVLNLSHMTRDYDTYQNTIDKLREIEQKEEKVKVYTKKY